MMLPETEYKNLPILMEIKQMGKRIWIKKKRLVRLAACCIVTMVISMASLHASLIFEHNGEVQFELTDNGNFSGAAIVEQSTETPTINAFIFDYQAQTALWAEDNHTVHFPNTFENKTRAFPETGLIIENKEGEQVAEILSEGKLYLHGDKRQLVGGVSYVDATAVFEWNLVVEEFEMQYQNITTPDGLEGKIESNGNDLYYYIKDHLGSIRQVISETGALAMSTNYQAYGNQERNLISPVTVRESFTGKEFDEDGAENGANGIQLYYFGARFYDSETGIWNGIDPAERLFNPYAYCAGNPVIFVDPNGEDFGISAVITGAILGAYLAGASYSVSTMYTDQQWSWEDFGMSALAGGIAGAVCAPVGAGVGQAIGSLTSEWAGGLAAFTTGFASGASSGFVGGFTSGLILSGGDMGAVFSGAGWGALSGGIFGGAGGLFQYGIDMKYSPYKWESGGSGYKGRGRFLQDEFADIAEGPVEGAYVPSTEYNPDYGRYGWTRKYSSGLDKPHFGIDHAQEIGTPVRASYEGRVRRASGRGLGGSRHVVRQQVTMSSGKTYNVDYGHLQKRIVRPGMFVKKGDIIGYLGTKGIPRAYPPHLHHQIWRSLPGGKMGFIQPRYNEWYLNYPMVQ